MSIVDEKISQYQQLLLALSIDRQSVQQLRMTRSGSMEALSDTIIRQSGQIARTAIGGFAQVANEADRLSMSDYMDTQVSRLPTEIRDNPQMIARLQQSYFLYKGLAKIGQGVAALDDMTGNFASKALRKIGEGFEYLGTQVRRTMRDDLGFSQRTAQNVGDLAEIAAQVLAPAAVSSVAKSSFVAAGVAKFRSNVAGAFTRAGEARTLGRLSIIRESEMIQSALDLPTEWNGQFKLIREIQPAATGNEFASSIYSKEVIFKDPRTQQMFRAFQRNDIDPNYIVRAGPDAGKSNISLLQKGRAPYTPADEQVIIHHMGQSTFGPFVEVTKTTHKPLLHNQYGYGQLHPTAPVIRAEFDPIRKAYWRAYAESFK
jgi:hypothetical protein